MSGGTLLTYPYASHFDGNQVPTMMGVEGTLGTADTGGTARPVPIGVNPLTNALYVENTGGQAGTNVNINSGGIQTGTLGTATVASDAGTSPFRFDGNQALWTNLGYKLDSTNDSVTAVFDGAGTVAVVSNLTSGSVRMTVGTLTTGTLQNLVTGTINALATGTITAGTVQLSYPSGTYLSAAGTYTVKSAAGILHVMNVGSLLGAGTLFNSAGTSGNVLWTTTTPNPQTFTFNQAFGSLTFAGTGSLNILITYA